MADLLVRLALRLRARRPARWLERRLRSLPWVDRLAKRRYAVHKRRELVAATRSEAVRKAMLGEAALPRGYGRGMDERIVEYPWVLARLDTAPGRVLDAGSTLNYGWLADDPRVAAKQVLVYNLAPEGTLDRDRYAYLYGDLRRIPLESASVNAVVSISTLEHVGMDNTAYTGRALDGPRDPRSCRTAMVELGRVLRPGGRLLLTVPYGKPMDLGWLQQFDAHGLSELLAAFPGAPERVDYFRHGDDGWARAMADECVGAEYVHVTSSSGRGIMTMATAVACAVLVRDPEV